MEISALIGKTLLKIEQSKEKDRLTFVCADGKQFAMYHSQDCCESVVVDDIVGDIKDIIGWPILSAEETSNHGEGGEGGESWTYTFYHIRTFIGTVTIKWLGSSNGYYSESVDFAEIEGRGIENIQDVDHELVN